MADVNANISVNIDTSAALSELKNLQRQISNFHNSIAKSSASAAIAQRNLQQGFVDSINATGQFAARIQTIRTSAESFTNSLEKNKFSMREYFRYGIASSKMFGKVFKTEFDTINKVAIERTRKLQTQYIKMGRDANGAMKAIAVTPLALDMEDLATKTMIAAQKQQLFNQLLSQGSTNLINFGKNTQWAGRQLMVGFTLPLSVFGSTASKVFMDLEMEMIRFKRVYGDLFTMDEETDSNMQNIRGLAQEFTRYGVTVQETLATAADAAAAGFSGAKLEATVRQATRLAVLGEVERQEAFKATIALQTAFQLNNNELADSINFLNAVENQSVVSLDNLTQAIPRVAPIIKGLGGDVRDLSVFLAAMQEGGVDATQAANGLKSALASIINPTRVAKDMLSSAGIDIKNIVDRNVGNLMRTVLDLADALKTLTPLARQKILEQLFGKFQFARVGALFENIAKEGSQAQRTMELMQMSAQDLAQLANKELAAIEESSATKFKAAVEELRAAIAPMGELFLQIVTPVLKAITSLVERFNNLSDNSKKTIGTIITILGGVAPIVLMLVGLFANFAGNLMKFFGILRNGYLKLTGQSKFLGEQTNYLTQEQMEAEAVASSLDQVHARLTQRFTSETEALFALTNAYRQASEAARRFAINNPGMMNPQGPMRKYNNGVSLVPGSGNRDTVPTMLTPGEAVIPKDMTKKYGGLINGMIADNIPGFNKGLPAIYGGQERYLGPYTMFAPGNTPGGFGMSKDFLGTEGFAQSLRNTAIAAGSIEGSIRLTDKVISEMATEVTPFTDQITEQLRIAASEMQQSGSAAKHISELFERKRQEIETILSNLSATGSRGASTAEGLRKFAYATDEDIMSSGNVRVPGVLIDPQTGKVVKHTQYSDRTGRAGSFQTKIENVTEKLPISVEGRVTRAHVLPESRVMLGGTRPLAGRGMGLPEDIRSAGMAEVEKRSAMVAEKAGLVAARSYSDTVEKNVRDIYESSRERQSPHRLASQDGKDDAIAYTSARDQELKRAASNYVQTDSGLLVPPGTPTGGGTTSGSSKVFLGMPGVRQKESLGQRLKGRYSALSDRMAERKASMQPMMNKFNGAAMALTSVGIAASMIPGPFGQIAQQAMPVIMGIQGLAMALPMLMTPMGAAVGIVAAVAAGFYLINKAQKNYIKSIKENADKEAKIRQGSADSIESYSKFLGEGGTPSERQFNLRGDQRYISAEGAKLAKFREYYEGVGKDSANLIKFAATKGSAEALTATAQDIANRVKVFGLDPKDIAANIKAAAELAGVNEIDLKSKLQELLAPNGDDILTTPLTLKARLQLLTQDTKASIDDIASEINKITNAKPLSLTSKMGYSLLNAVGGRGGQTEAAQIQFEKDQLRQASVTNALTLSFKQQKEAVALLNAEYVDGTIKRKDYASQHDQLMSNLRELQTALVLLAEKSPEAYSSVIDSVFEPLVAKNKKFGKEVREDFNKLSTELQSEIVVGITTGGMSLVEIKELVLLMDGWEDKTIEQQVDILANIPSTSTDIVKKFIEYRVALEKQANLKIQQDDIQKRLGTAKVIMSIEEQIARARMGADSAAYRLSIENTQKLKKELDALYKAQKGSPTIEGTSNITEDEDGKDPYAFLEPLLSRLKQVRKESINAAGGVDYFVKLLSKDIKGFKGMDQMLRAAGATQGFIDIVNGLDSDQLKLFGDRLYKIKDGKVIFGELGEAIQAYTKEVETGILQDSMQQVVVDAENQYKAYVKLRAAGLSASKTLEILAEKGLAAAIAAEKVDSVDFKNFVAGAKKSTEETKKLAKELKTLRFEAEQEQETEADKMDDFFAYEEARIKLEKYRQFTMERGKSPEAFAREEIRAKEDALEAAQDEVNKIQDKIDKEQEYLEQYNRGIELINRQEDVINEEYDKRNESIDQQIDALDKVQRLNQNIAENQKRQTTLADALSTGDIAAAAQIAQEMRAASAEQSIEAQKAALEEQKNRLEAERLAKINALTFETNQGLKTKDELNAMILEKEDLIYQIQNTTLKDAEAIVKAKQDELDTANEILKKYEEDLADAIGNIKTESGLTKGEWELIRDAVNATNDYFDTIITDLDAIATGTLSIASAWDAVTDAIKNAIAAQAAFTGSNSGNVISTTNTNEGKVDSKVVITSPGGTDFTAKQVQEQIDSLTKLRDTTEAGTGINFLLKENIDELTDALKNPKAPDAQVDERSKFLAMQKLTEESNAAKSMFRGIGAYGMMYESKGGFIKPKYLAAGGFARGSDKIPAMLTPGEFVMNKYAVQSYGLDKMKAINSGEYNGDSMYNYNLTVNVKSDANPNEIANTVMGQLRQIESKRLRRDKI